MKRPLSEDELWGPMGEQFWAKVDWDKDKKGKKRKSESTDLDETDRKIAKLKDIRRRLDEDDAAREEEERRQIEEAESEAAEALASLAQADAYEQFRGYRATGYHTGYASMADPSVYNRYSWKGSTRP